MTKDYEMGLFVINHLKNLGINILTIGHAIENKNLNKSFELIKKYPNIQKNEFIEKMQIEEVLY